MTENDVKNFFYFVPMHCLENIVSYSVLEDTTLDKIEAELNDLMILQFAPYVTADGYLAINRNEYIHFAGYWLIGRVTLDDVKIVYRSAVKLSVYMDNENSYMRGKDTLSRLMYLDFITMCYRFIGLTNIDLFNCVDVLDDYYKSKFEGSLCPVLYTQAQEFGSEVTEMPDDVPHYNVSSDDAVLSEVCIAKDSLSVYVKYNSYTSKDLITVITIPSDDLSQEQVIDLLSNRNVRILLFKAALTMIDCDITENGFEFYSDSQPLNDVDASYGELSEYLEVLE